MKKILSVLLLLLFAIAGIGQTLQEDGTILSADGNLKFTVVSGTNVYVSAANKDISGDIVIPATVTVTKTVVNEETGEEEEVGTTYTVTQIGKGSTSTSFYQCKKITSVTIPNTVTSIKSYGFSGCAELTSVTFEEPCQLTSIGNYAFQVCTKLADFEIPSTVTNFGNSAFNKCKALTSITIPSGVKSIPLLCFSETGITELTVPNTVTSIGNLAFSKCEKMETFTFEEDSQVKTIGNMVFSSCKSLTEIILPEHITSLGNETFYNCQNLLVVKIPNSVTSIGEEMFAYCDTIPHITYPSKLKSLGLKNIHLQNSEAKQMKSTELTIPGSVETTTGTLPTNLNKIYLMGTTWPTNFRANHASRTDMTVYVKPSAYQKMKDEMLLGETPVSGTYKIQNAGTEKYVQVKSKYYAKPDATETDATEVHVGVAEQMGPGAYKVNSLSGDTPDGETVEVYNYIPTAVALAKMVVENYEGSNGKTLEEEDQETIKALIDEYVESYAYMQVQETGKAGQMYAFVELPEMPEEVEAMALKYGVTDGAWNWVVRKVETILNSLNSNSANFNTVKSYVLNNIGNIEPGNTYYLTAEENNTFGYVKVEELASAGDYAKWNVSVTELDQEAPGFKLETQIPVTFGAGKKYITMCRDFDVDLSHSEGLKAYVPTSYNPETDMVELEEISYVPSRLKADELGVDEYVGVILERTAEDVSEEATLYYTMGENDCYSGHQDKQENLTSRNWMVGANDRTYVEMEEDGKTNYGLNAGMVKKYSKAGWLAYNKAYISTDGIDDDNHGGKTTTSLGLSKKASQQTGVKRISAKELGVDMWFDLNGRFVANPVEGNIYIHNGKKVKK